MNDSPHPALLILVFLMFGTIAVGCLFFSRQIQAFGIRNTPTRSWEPQFLKRAREGRTALWSIRATGLIALIATVLFALAYFYGV